MTMTVYCVYETIVCECRQPPRSANRFILGTLDSKEAFAMANQHGYMVSESSITYDTEDEYRQAVERFHANNPSPPDAQRCTRPPDIVD